MLRLSKLLCLSELLQHYVWCLFLHLKLGIGVNQYLRLSYWGIKFLVVAEEGLCSNNRLLELVSLRIVEQGLSVNELGWLVDGGSLL